MSIVLAEKICKALSEGIVDPDAIATHIGHAGSLPAIEKILLEIDPNKYKELSPTYGGYKSTKTLLDYAAAFVDRYGIEALQQYEHFSEWCGCMGPRDGYAECYCGMSVALEKNRESLIAQLEVRGHAGNEDE